MRQQMMQARSSADGQLYSWSSQGNDWNGLGFTGPGTPLDIAIAIRSAPSQPVAGQSLTLAGIPSAEAVGVPSVGFTIPITSFTAVQDSWIHDTVLFTASGSGGNTYKKHNPSARYIIYTSDTSLPLEAVFFDATQTISFYVNGAFNQYAVLTGTSGVKQTLTVTLPAGPKVVEIEEEGTSITGIGGVGSNLHLVPYYAPKKRVVVYGTSINVGYDAGATFSLGWTQLIRHAVPAFDVINQSVLGAMLHDDNSTSSARAAYVSSLASALDGTVENVWFNDRETNDWGGNQWGSAANYGSALADLYDKLHAAYPALKIYHQTALLRSNPGEGVAVGGALLQDFRNAAISAASSRSWVTTIDGTAIPGITYIDGLHPGQVGHAAIAAYEQSNVWPTF